jgi:hypothetical protein
VIDQDELPGSREVDSYGTPGSPLVIDDKGLLFGCEKRLCAANKTASNSKLMNGTILDGVKDGAIVTINKVRYAVTSINKKLVLVKL